MLNATPIKKPSRALTPWELPSLLTPFHSLQHSERKKRSPKERVHFPAILGFIYRSRFVVASQVQRRFADVLRSARTTRRHLEELITLGYLGVAPARGVSPNFPKVYYVTGRGVKKLRESLSSQGKPWRATRVDRQGRSSREGYSADRVIHEILTTEFLLAVWQTVHQRTDLELLTIQRRSLAKHSSFQVTVGNRQSRLVPDAMFLFRHASGGMVCCFVEMDNGTMNRKQIRSKYNRYAAWAASAAGKEYLLSLYRRHGATDPRPVFRLLIVARSRMGDDDHRRLKELRGPVAKLPTTLQNQLWFAAVTDLQRCQSQQQPLDAAIWERGGNTGSQPPRPLCSLFPPTDSAGK